MLCGQPDSEDSIEHYSVCCALREVAARHLKLHPRDHFNLYAFTCTNPLVNTKEKLVRTALLIYSAYRASNFQRHAPTPLKGTELYHGLCQWVAEGARNHSTSGAILARNWRELPEQRLPLVPWSFPSLSCLPF